MDELKQIKIIYPQTNLHNYWDPLTSQVEEIECTAEHICNIKKQSRGKYQKTVNFSLTPNHQDKNSYAWQQKLRGETTIKKKITTWPNQKLVLVYWMEQSHLQSARQGPHQEQDCKGTPPSLPIRILVMLKYPHGKIAQSTKVKKCNTRYENQKGPLIWYQNWCSIH